MRLQAAADAARAAAPDARPEWQQLPAVRNRRVYAVDGNAYLNRPGPRIVDSAELLAGLIQPGFFAAKIPPDSYVRVRDGESALQLVQLLNPKRDSPQSAYA